ncbi:hypothetical protein O6H91_21G000900 [Diphasiastrum complanatum]|uniref:Uncharacterized protein n=1 Tax=Diphasiastrum complanatum TaxID=34168 RepID=A0ACC2AGZ1_DIPCM|nr:hypothetical protein O6H91_21G000900 [Diphasiastrum complanatum]
MESEQEAPISAKAQEQLQKLVRVCKTYSDAASLFPDHFISESGNLSPPLRRAAAQTVPMLQFYQEKRHLLAASPHPDRLIEKIEYLKDSGQILVDPDLKKLVARDGGIEVSTSDSIESKSTDGEALVEPLNPSHSGSEDYSNLSRPNKENDELSRPGTRGLATQIQNLVLTEATVNVKRSSHQNEKSFELPKPLIEGISYPATPQWNIERPFLTGQILHQDVSSQKKMSSRGGMSDRESRSNVENDRAIGLFAASVQELLVIDDLLFLMVGIEGKYIHVKQGRLKDTSMVFQMDSSMDLSLCELTKRVLPLCENYIIVSQFTETRSHFKYGLVNHAFAAALRAILQDYHAMVAQLEHQFRLARLSLQGLWFFCQPMMGAMQALSVVLRRASAKQLSGAAILNLLQSQAAAMAGDNAARSLLQKLAHAASAPYFRMLERWVYEGVIDDPYGEFFIDENKGLQKESLSQDYNATYWQQRYSLRHDIPGFLTSVAETILTTGKYLNAVRECGHTIRIPFSDDVKLTNAGARHQYLDRINIAYNFASAELLNLIINKFDLLARLRSVKHYFLLDQGDFLVHFMDIAKEELVKRPSAVSKEKLQSLLELALRTSVAAADPYHEDLTCNVERLSLVAQLQHILKDRAVFSEPNFLSELLKIDLSSLETASQGTAESLNGLETFTLDYKVRWPLSLVISRKALTKYQLIFRHLFHCKHVERQLCTTWQAHQATRGLGFVGTSMQRSYVLCQQMLHFMQSFEHYMTFEVLEPNWHIMGSKLQSSKSVDEVIQHHDFFLNDCLKKCMVLWPSILKKLEKLKDVCLQYARATQWLIPSLFVPQQNNHDPLSQNGNKSQDVKGFKGTNRLRNAKTQLTLVKTEDSNFKSVIGKMADDFKKELSELLLMLSTGSQTEPCLAHMAQSFQALGQV